jgi:hypothetical protein
MSRKQYDMQDTETSSLRITDEIQQEYDIKYSNEDIQWATIGKIKPPGTHIKGLVF